jgi:hypothetical protein
MRTSAAWIGAALFFVAVPSLSAVSVYVPVGELADRAPIAVEATVAGVASGYDPETGSVATYVTLLVDRSHRGAASLTKIVLRERGGRFGDLVHETDAVPVYVPGERVFAFVEIAPDGSPRTAFDFFGKFVLDDGAGVAGRRAVRDLGGQGTIFGRPHAGDLETFRLRDLVAAVTRERRRPRTRPPSGGGASESPGPGDARGVFAPPEFDRLIWDGGSPPPPVLRPSSGEVDLRAADRAGAARPEFGPLSPSSPTRWTQADSGQSVVVHVEPARNPLSNDALAVAQIRRAVDAWTNVPESRLGVSMGNENENFTGLNAQSPAKAYPPKNVVLFGDPYQDIADPSGCSGTLAIGGYWRSGTPSGTVNNVSFYPATRLYVIFNNNFECFLGNTENLAEVATHELGHGLGFGHSGVNDAVMRSYAYGGGRGPRLGDDDRDGAHCHYPHQFTLLAPNGGETWRVGDLETVSWVSSLENGPDPGVVDIERSADGGATWTPVAVSTPNDGAHGWVVSGPAGGQNRLRVIRPNRVVPTPAPYPAACSLDASNGNFQVLDALPVAGTVPDGGAEPLRVAAGAGGSVVVTWGASCSAEASEYAVYEGSLDALRTMAWDHLPVTCAAGLDRSHAFVPAPGARYFLAAPLAGGNQGSLGDASWGPRPASAGACAPTEASSCP